MLGAIIVHESLRFLYLGCGLPTLFAQTPPDLAFELGRAIDLRQCLTHIPFGFPIFLVIKVVYRFELHEAVVNHQGIILRYIIFTVLVVELVHWTLLQERT